MPALTNPRWELIAVARAGGASVKESVLSGGLKYDRSSATKMFKRPEIVARIAEIHTERANTERRIAAVAVQEAGVDKAWVIRHLRHIALAAMRGHPLYDKTGTQLRDAQGNPRYAKPDFKAAVDALRLIGLEHGMFITRAEIGQPGDFERMSDQELQAELVSTAEKLGLPADAIKMLEYAGAEDEEDE